MNDPQKPERVGSVVSLLSLVSCVSLLVFGVASFLLSLAFLEKSGVLIGGALLFHGTFELRKRERFLKSRSESFASQLAWNQIGLAASVSVYLLWRYLQFDDAALLAVLEQEPVKTLLEQWPPEFVSEFKELLPSLAALSYSLAGVVAILGCVGMAALYRREGKRLAALGD